MAAVVMAAKGRSVDGGGGAGVVDASGDASATTVAFFAALFAARRATSVARRHAPKLSKPPRCHNSIVRDQYLSSAAVPPAGCSLTKPRGATNLARRYDKSEMQKYAAGKRGLLEGRHFH